jgi:uncharacterized protein (TIGR03085 family)
MARTERAQLCDLALQVGPDAPTLSGSWTVRDLVAHLLVREGNPAALGIALPVLARVTDQAMARTARRDFAANVERLRHGPPVYSPLAVPKLDTVFNTLEMFVHHEDVRRARDGWEPRELTRRDEALLWQQVGMAGRGLVRDAPVGVVIERSDKDARRVLKPGEPTVVVRGLPSEVTLFLYGRKPQARVELSGPPEAVAALTGSALGF